MLAFLVFPVWKESRVTRVRPAVLVFQVWTDVTEPEEREESLGILEDLDLMEIRVFQD